MKVPPSFSCINNRYNFESFESYGVLDECNIYELDPSFSCKILLDSMDVTLRFLIRG